MRARALCGAVGLAFGGCDGTTYLSVGEGGLVDPAGAVAGADGLYVPLPATGDVVRIVDGEPEAQRLDLGAHSVQRLEVTPSGQVIARTIGRTCDDGAGDPQFVDECLGDLDTVGFADLLQGDGVGRSLDVASWYAAATFAPDGRWAAAPIDPQADTTGGGLVNLTSLLVLDLASGARFDVPVGFAADRVLFTEDATGAATGVVVLSRSAVAYVDLTAPLPQVRTTYPLTLSGQSAIVPAEVALTPDGRYAMVTIQGAAELYVLDLVSPSIDIVTLAGRPSDLAVDVQGDQTLIVYGATKAVQFLDHELFELTTLTLDQPATTITMVPGAALLTGSNAALVRVDLASRDLDTVRLGAAPGPVLVAPDASYAVVLAAGDSPQLELVDLSVTDGRLRTQSTAFRLDGAAVGVTFLSAPSPRVIVLQRGVDRLFELSWPDLAVTALDLPASPVTLGRYDDDTLWITLDDPLGAVGLYTPGAELQTVAGFGRLGLYDRPELLVEGR